MGIYTGYFDESSHEDETYFVMGGLILDAENADAFDKDWDMAIKNLPLLDGRPFLHTADFVSGNGLYDPDWKARYDEKLAILSAAARVINRYSLQAITSVVHMDDFRALDAVFKASETLGHPFTVAARIAYQHMQQWAVRNSIFTPIKMVLEARQGAIGDVIDMFQINGHPIPAPENKGLPQLQAADYIAWMRLKRYHPTSSYERVKDSWKQINPWLYTDQDFTLDSMLATLAKAADQYPEIEFPGRNDDRTLVTFNGNFKRPRKPFKGTARPRTLKSQ